MWAVRSPVGQYRGREFNHASGEQLHSGAGLSAAAMEYTSLPLDYYATGIRYLYGRTAWERRRRTSCGSSAYDSRVGHSHTDIGNFNLWRGGRWLSRETTGYVNTITGTGTRTKPLTAQRESWPTTEFCSGPSFPVRGDLTLGLMPESPTQTTVRRLDSQPGYVYADVDMTAQYFGLPARLSTIRAR